MEIYDWRGTWINAYAGSGAGQRFGAAVSSVGTCSAGNPTDFVVGVPGINAVRRFDGISPTSSGTWNSGSQGYGSSLCPSYGFTPIDHKANYFVVGAPAAGLAEFRVTTSGNSCGADSYVPSTAGLPPMNNLGFSSSWVGQLFPASLSCSGSTEDWVAIGAPSLGSGVGSYVVVAAGEVCSVTALPAPYNAAGGSSTFGYALTELDDVDQDGLDDFAVADPLLGVVWVY